MENILKDKLSKVLFHGTLMDRASNIVYGGINFNLLNNRADFGKGFYTTDSYSLAEATARTRYEQELYKNGSALSPVVMRIKVKCPNILDYNIKELYGETEEWKKFVCANRWSSKIQRYNPEIDNNIDLKYDISIGLTADGRINVIDKLIKKDNYKLSDQFLKNINPYYTSYKDKATGILKNTKAYQISFHNEKFIKDYIKFFDYDILLLRMEE